MVTQLGYEHLPPAGPVAARTIHGCYDSGGNVKVIDASATCPKTYTSLNWSRPGRSTGPQDGA